MKLLDAFKEQLKALGELRYVWLTSFNLSIEFVENYLVPAVLSMDPPKNRADYEHYQIALTERKVDLRVFCDKRFMEADKNKRTAIPVHGVSPAQWPDWFSKESLFHPKVIYLEDVHGRRILGTGSANLTIGGWGRNQEVFSFFAIETRGQYKAVRMFFNQISANVGIPDQLPDRRLPAKEGRWRFVHSFQKDSFIEQLFENTRSKELLVWSPYLPTDLPAFVRKLRKAVGVEDLEIHLVPDRIHGQYIRTPWTDTLQAMVDGSELSFYENPSARHHNVELCHAKVWKLGGKLAIGSWNFTTKGSNVRDEQGAWDTSVNIEAGVILPEGSSWQNAVGKPIRLNADNFASAELLKEESLNVPDQLPFDLRVTFDWREERYNFSGMWHDGKPEEGYKVKVPCLGRVIPLVWMPQKGELKVRGEVIRDAQELLTERRFEVWHEGKSVHRALITETNLEFRRAQAFGSLNDLLDAFVIGGEPGPGDDIPFRLPVNPNSESLENELVQEAETGVSAATSEISFFRLFQAIHQYAEKLDAVNSVIDLNRWAFSTPGCLLELVEKTKARIAAESSVFNWFLAQEVKTLCAKAHEKRSRLLKTEDSVSKVRWDELDVPLPQLPPTIQDRYVAMIRMECGYAYA